MKKDKYNKIAVSILIASIIGAIVLLIIIYIQYKKMKNTIIAPVKGKITSGFGTRIHPVTKVESYHNGVDISAPIGTGIVAPLDGKVISIYENNTGGKQLVLQHEGGYKTGYAHLNGYNVEMGDAVKQGAVIAYVGNTGQSTGAHLHFTLTSPVGIKLNPTDYISFL